MSELSPEDLGLLRDSLGAYLSDRYDEAEQRRRSEAGVGEASRHWRAFADELGLLGLGFEPEQGGLGGGAADRAAIMEAFGRHLVLEPYLSTVVLFGGALRGCTATRATEWIAGLVSGSVTVAFAHGEPTARYDPAYTALSARLVGDDYVLDGTKSVVLDAPAATHLLVTARTAGQAGDRAGLSLFVVDVAAPGIARRDYRTISGRPASEIDFGAVRVPADRLLTAEGTALPLIEAMLDEAALMICAEALGVMERLFGDTVAYAAQRRQFGQPLANFQVLQHRMADMLIAKEHSTSIVRTALDHVAAGPRERARWVSAAKVFVGKSLRFVAQQAVQIHGGMGITDELFVGRLFKRAVEIERQFGTIGFHLKRYAALTDESTAPEARSSTQDRGPDHAGFRDEVRDFIAANYPAAKRQANARQAGLFAEPELGTWWQATLHEKGWVAPNWPVEHGGTGWDAVQRHIFATESARADAPLICKLGLELAAPAIMKYGTEAQKAYFLPRILSGEIYFCQGFSEPGAGSDLASLTTRAVRDGDRYIVNGAKMWTTHAHFANWIFLLARTSTDGKPQTGISFLLAPMEAPGITVRPIRSMSGEHEVNEVFFDDVEVPVANRIGAENEGWTVTKYLLEFERGGEFAALCQGLLEKAKAIARKQPGDAGGMLWDDPEFRARACAHEIDILALAATEDRTVAGAAAGRNIGPVAAGIMKVTSSRLYQRSAELGMEALGDYAMPDQHAALPVGSNQSVIGPDYAAAATARHLNARAWSIFGGSNEIQRNIIAALGCRPR